jgi:nucleotide-binding universal stress UspA family protein
VDPVSDTEAPILFAYDGSDQAKAAIRQAGEQLRNGRRAVVLTVWRPLAGIPFVAAPGVPGAGYQEMVERDAQRVAREGAELARETGFDAEPRAEQGDPVWEQIVEAAEETGAGVIVMGSHGRTGISLVLLGSVAAATARHTERPVLIAHSAPETNGAQAA